MRGADAGAPGPGDAAEPRSLEEEFGQMDLEAAEQLYEALRAVRERHRAPGKKPDNAAWEEKLRAEVQEMVTKARNVVRNTDESVAQRAVQLMLRTDLVNACASRLASVLKQIKMKEVADLITTVWHSYASISKDWEGLLQDQEEALESSMEAREEEAAAEIRSLQAQLEEAIVRNDEHARLLTARDREVESLRSQLQEESLRARSMAADHGRAGDRPSSSRAFASAVAEDAGHRSAASRSTQSAHVSPRPGAANGDVVGRGGVAGAGGPRTKRKELTKGKVLEIVREVYRSKERSDELFKEGKQERETLEEHLYRYMNTKFGLRPLIIEHVELLLTGLQKYKDNSVEILLFSKILANQVEEELRFEMESLRKSVVEVLRQVLQMKFRDSSSFQRDAMLKERVEGLLPQEEAFVIVKSMQSAEESTEVASVLQRKLEQRVVRINKELRTDEQRVTRPNALEFEEFIEVILGVHLRHHEAKIAEIVTCFKRIDLESRGYLSEDQFRLFCQTIDPNITSDQIDTLLDVLDPQSTHRVTFSSCVSALVPHS